MNPELQRRPFIGGPNVRWVIYNGHNQRTDNVLAVISSFNHVHDEKEAPLGDESEPTCG